MHLIICFCFSFIGVIQSLPVTEYIKMVDVWMLFMMFYPFLIVSLYTIKEVLKKGNDIEKINNDWIDKNEKKIKMVSCLLSWGLPLLMSIFVSFYWTVGLVNHFSTDLESVCQ